MYHCQAHTLHARVSMDASVPVASSVSVDAVFQWRKRFGGSMPAGLVPCRQSYTADAVFRWRQCCSVTVSALFQWKQCWQCFIRFSVGRVPEDAVPAEFNCMQCFSGGCVSVCQCRNCFSGSCTSSVAKDALPAVFV